MPCPSLYDLPNKCFSYHKWNPGNGQLAKARDPGGAGFPSPLARDLMLDREGQNHYTITNKSDEHNVRQEIEESTKRE